MYVAALTFIYLSTREYSAVISSRLPPGVGCGHVGYSMRTAAKYGIIGEAARFVPVEIKISEMS